MAGKVKSGGLLFERRVARIVTPGTLVDEKFIEATENNFLLAIHGKDTIEGPSDDASSVGLAWLDLSTGEMYTQATTLTNLGSDLLRVSPREIVMKQDISTHTRKILTQALEKETATLTHYSKPITLDSVSAWSSRLESPISPSEASMFTEEETSSGSLLLEYVREQLLDSGMKLQPPIRRIESDNMGIDKNTMRGLEILERAQTSTAGGKGSLLHSIRRTVTKGGARLLRERISSPSTSLKIINQRLNLVESFVICPDLRSRLISLLEQTFDSQRIAQKFALGKGDADDLVSLHRTITAISSITQIFQPFIKVLDEPLKGSVLDQLSKLTLESPLQLAQTIAYAIDEDALLAHHLEEMRESAEVVSKAHNILSAAGNEEDAQMIAGRAKSRGIKLTQPDKPARVELELDIGSVDFETSNHNVPVVPGDEPEVESIDNNNLKESWTMRRTASTILGNLHSELDDLIQQKVKLTQTLQENTGANSLSLRWTPGLGHHIHVKGVRDIRNTLERLPLARNIGSSKSTRTFYVSDWSKLGTQIDQIRLQIRIEEQRVFQTLRDGVITNLASLRRNAAVLDELDVACAFATLSIERNLTRPILNNTRTHKIISGKHPTVMLGLDEAGRSFVSNDCMVGDAELIWLITGPNMAGKSTFLRQNALISILAQVGSFVPAKHAEIGIVDQIFSRIGSADNLYQDQSTFMIEMLETAHILRQATPRSFVIMDEVGRGTTPEDGIAISYACLHHLYNINKCRTLFATHFHKLCDMTREWPKLANYCTDVRIDEAGGGSFSYVHRLRRGVNRESHALKVAELAGIPSRALRIAADAKAAMLLGEMGGGSDPPEDVGSVVASGRS